MVRMFSVGEKTEVNLKFCRAAHATVCGLNAVTQIGSSGRSGRGQMPTLS